MKKRKVINLKKEKALPMKRIDAAGGVLYRNVNISEEILLIFRRGFWDLPKGKREEHETFEDCAVREVSEEVGIEAPILEHYLTDTYHEYVEQGVRIGKSTKWYAMKLSNRDTRLKPQSEEGITDLLWVTLPKAKEKIGFNNLVRVLDAFEKR